MGMDLVEAGNSKGRVLRHNRGVWNKFRSTSEGATVGLARLDMTLTTMCCRTGEHVELVVTWLVDLWYTDESVSGGRACVGREKREGKERVHWIGLRVSTPSGGGVA
jgi:hypothetical protein